MGRHQNQISHPLINSAARFPGDRLTNGDRIHGTFDIVLMVSNYLNRYGSIWTELQLKPSILEPNRYI